jgi:signal transduction histidine kinase
MSTLRETIWILKTKNLTVNQLFDLLKVYTDKHLVKNLNVGVLYTEDITMIKHLSPTISLNLYRIIQEIIQNIIKHAHTTNVEFKLVSNQKIVIEISDNGVGFDYDNLQRKSGLENMEYRANEINYHIDIRSREGLGTKFKIEEL